MACSPCGSGRVAPILSGPDVVLWSQEHDRAGKGPHPRPRGLVLVAHRYCTALARVGLRGRVPRARTPDRRPPVAKDCLAVSATREPAHPSPERCVPARTETTTLWEACFHRTCVVPPWLAPALLIITAPAGIQEGAIMIPVGRLSTPIPTRPRSTTVSFCEALAANAPTPQTDLAAVQDKWRQCCRVHFLSTDIHGFRGKPRDYLHCLFVPALLSWRS